MAFRLLVSLVLSRHEHLELAPKQFMAINQQFFCNDRRAVANLEKPKFVVLEVLGQKKR